MGVGKLKKASIWGLAVVLILSLFGCSHALPRGNAQKVLFSIFYVQESGIGAIIEGLKVYDGKVIEYGHGWDAFFNLTNDEDLSRLVSLLYSEPFVNRLSKFTDDCGECNKMQIHFKSGRDEYHIVIPEEKITPDVTELFTLVDKIGKEGFGSRYKLNLVGKIPQQPK
jgi:hypothetical protein